MIQWTMLEPCCFEISLDATLTRVSVHYMCNDEFFVPIDMGILFLYNITCTPLLKLLFVYWNTRHYFQFHCFNKGISSALYVHDRDRENILYSTNFFIYLSIYLFYQIRRELF